MVLIVHSSSLSSSVTLSKSGLTQRAHGSRRTGDTANGTAFRVLGRTKSTGDAKRGRGQPGLCAFAGLPLRASVWLETAVERWEAF